MLGGVDGGTPWQLFDLRADPWQLRNLVGDPAYAEPAADLHRRLRAALVARGDHYVLAPAFGEAALNAWR